MDRVAERTTYRARRAEDGAAVMIQVFDLERMGPDASAKIREITHDYELSRELADEGILAHLALERREGSLILVSEDLGGQTLAQLIARQRPRLVDALRIFIALARILGALHPRGVIHKDIKSDNILVGPELSPIKLTGLGFATRKRAKEGRAEKASRSSRIEGTLAYMSPEQTGRFGQGVDHRSDLYSLGVVFYETLTGHLPFSSTDPLELVYSHIAREPIPPCQALGSVPKTLSDIVMKLLSKVPSDRYESAHGLEVDLEICLESLIAKGHIDDFPLARSDLSSRFRIPEKPYGRDRQVAALMAAFAEVERGAARMVIIRGPSGTGKRALVSAVQRPIVEKGAYFGAGKVDRSQPGVPYAALIEALREVFAQILGESDERVSLWKRSLLGALGQKARVLADLIPELELLLGELPPAEELGPQEAQNRLSLAFEELIAALAAAAEERPLCLFINELQWADSASLKLLQTLMSSPDDPSHENRHLLLLGACREEELGESPALSQTLEAIQRANGSIETLRLGPFELSDVAELIADTLKIELESCLPLARLVVEKTGGNPFFVTQFLTTLHQDGLFDFDPQERTWRWDLAQIREARFTENIVALMEMRLERLGESSRHLLSLAACIGSRFELRILRELAGGEGEKIALELEEAREAGLIVRCRERRASEGAEGQLVYTFSHEPVRQAAYESIAETERAAIHLSIGRAMLGLFAPGELEERIFEVAEQLNRGVACAEDRPTQERICTLDLTAARKARAVAAYDAALAFLGVARSLLSEDDFELRYELCRDVHASYAEALALVGRAEEAEIAFDGFIDRLKTTEDKGACHLRQSEALQSAGKPAASYAFALRGLSLFGVRMPDSVGDAERAIGEQLTRLLREETLVALETRESAPEEENLLSRLYERLIISSYFAAPFNLGLAICKGVEHILERGIAVESSTIVAWFATLAGLVGQLRLSVELAELSLKLCASSKSSYARGKTETVAYAQCLCWKYPYEEALAAMAETYERCHSVGDFQYASYMLLTRYIVRHTRGNDTRDELALCRAWHDYCHKYVPLELGQAKIRIHGLARVMGIEDEPIDVAGIVEAYAAEKNSTDVCESLLEIAETHALFGEYEAAYEASMRAEPMLLAGAAGNLLLHLTFHETKVHACARLFAAAEEPEAKEAYRQGAASSLEKLEFWAEFAPENFKAYHDLAAAEFARAQGEDERAFVLYLRALEHARAHGQTRIEARANELLGELARTRGHGFAKGFFDEARMLYEACGASGKARALKGERERSASLSSSISISISTAETSLGFDAEATYASGVDVIDVLTVVKASQSIASELDLSKLLERLMRLMVENAGARRAVLLLAREDRWMVEASMRVSPDKLEVGLSTPLEAYGELPKTIALYVARTKEPVVLGDAMKESRFASDVYIATHKPRSILCLCMTQEGRVTGILYLENEIAANVFTRARVELSRLLASQAAIAVDNALLYARVSAMSEAQRRANEDLEREVVRRTEELHVANERLKLELVERERSEEERIQLKEQIIEVQNQRLAELSTPLIPITERIMVMPLIGTMDEARAHQALEAALRSVAEQRAEVVIIDITGVSMVDTAVAGTLMRTSSALALLGARAVITGMSPVVAQTLVNLDIDLGKVVTRGTLESGIAYALEGSRKAGRR